VIDVAREAATDVVREVRRIGDIDEAGQRVEGAIRVGSIPVIVIAGRSAIHTDQYRTTIQTPTSSHHES